jgi:protoporphyrinogen oxidase
MAKINKKATIIGGGLSGLVVGYELSKKGFRITIWEKEKDLGGLAGSFKLNGTWLEKAYHHIFKTDREMIRLIKELGLEKKLEWRESSIGVYYQKKIYPFVTPKEILRFGALGWVDKLRLGMVGWFLQHDPNWRKYIRVPAWEWMKKWCGEKAYKVIWEPLLIGKFHDQYKRVSMAWLWARIHTRGGSKDKDGKERLGYLRGGFEQVTKRLAEEIIKRGGKIRLGEEFDEKNLSNDELTISTRAIKGVDYLGAVTLVFTSKQSLSRYYWHNINDIKSPFLAMIQHTNFINKSDYGGEEIYYLGTYVPHGHKYFKADQRTIETEWFGYLKKIFPDFDRKKVEQSFLFKFKNAQHIVDGDYELHLPPKKLGERRYQLHFSQVFPEDRGMNYAVKEATALALEITEKESSSNC